MNANATPDSPVHDLAAHDGEPSAPADSADPAAADADAEQVAAEPGWIEVGSPKRRTMPPAWSDEARGNAWAQAQSPAGPAQRPAALQVELMDEEQQESAVPSADEADELPSDEADELPSDEAAATEEGSDLDEGFSPNEGSSPDEALGPDDDAVDAAAPALRGVRLRRPPRVSHNRPFRKPARRNSPPTPVSDGNGPADVWVQGPTDEELLAAAPEVASEPIATEVSATEVSAPEAPTLQRDGNTAEAAAQTAELVALDGADAERSEIDATEQLAQASEETAELAALDGADSEDLTGKEAPAALSADDPESGARWQVVTDSEPEPTVLDAADPGTTGPDLVETAEQAAAAPETEQLEPLRSDITDPDIADPDIADPALTPPSDPAAADRAPVAEQSASAPNSAAEQAPPAEEAPSEQTPSAAREGAGTLSGALDVVAPHLRTHRPALIVGLTALVLSIWLLVAAPFPLKYSVDAAVAAAGAEMPTLAAVGADPATSLLIAAGVLAAMVALQAAFRAVSVSALNRAGSRVATDLRSRLLSHLHRLSPGRDIDSLDQTTPPLIDDVARLRDLVAHSGPRIAAGLLALASLLVVVLIVEPMAALIVVVTGGLYALVTRGSLRLVRKRDAAAEAEEAALADTADELLAATRTVQSYGLEDRAERGLTEIGARAGRSRAAARRARAIGDFLAELVAGLGVAAALLLGGWRMSAGTMSPGELTLVIAYVLIALVLIREVVRHSGTVKATVASGDRVGDLLAHRAGITEPGRTQPIDRVRGEIVFSAITAPGPRGALFDAVSLVIPAGQHVAMLDREGIETSALISYLQRFDQPETGRVLLDRYDTRAVPLADLRRQMAVVQREPALFTDTVRENIRVGHPEASDDEVTQAARRAGADEFITLLPEGYDTQLLRRGEDLSDGQRRRIAIARALLRDAPIVVLDGADADIAPTERDAVRSGLAALVDGRTALIHSRDPENILTTDRVLWFESGDLTEDGAPGQLAEDPDSWLSSWIHAADQAGR